MSGGITVQDGDIVHIDNGFGAQINHSQNGELTLPFPANPVDLTVSNVSITNDGIATMTLADSAGEGLTFSSTGTPSWGPNPEPIRMLASYGAQGTLSQGTSFLNHDFTSFSISFDAGTAYAFWKLNFVSSSGGSPPKPAPTPSAGGGGGGGQNPGDPITVGQILYICERHPTIDT